MPNNISNEKMRQLLSSSYLQKLNIKMIADTHSNSSSREITNENFKSLGWIVECVQGFPLEFLLSLKVPDNPRENVEYVIIWNAAENRYELSGETANIYAGKWKIREDEILIIKEDYQHILVGKCVIDGELDLKGELIIL